MIAGFINLIIFLSLSMSTLVPIYLVTFHKSLQSNSFFIFSFLLSRSWPCPPLYSCPPRIATQWTFLPWTTCNANMGWPCSFCTSETQMLWAVPWRMLLLPAQFPRWSRGAPKLLTPHCLVVFDALWSFPNVLLVCSSTPCVVPLLWLPGPLPWSVLLCTLCQLVHKCAQILTRPPCTPFPCGPQTALSGMHHTHPAVTLSRLCNLPIEPI